MVKLVSITIPDELKTVWERLPNKSAWVTQHLRALGGWPEDHTHTSWSDTLGMCNMYHKDGVCKTCMRDMGLIEYEIIEEYNLRSREYDAVEQSRYLAMRRSARGEEE